MLCQLLSLDKRYHVINCFSFINADNLLTTDNFIETINTGITTNLTLQNKINYKFLKKKSTNDPIIVSMTVCFS